MHLVSGISAHAQRDRSRRRRQEEGGGGCDQFTDTKHSSWRGSSKQLEEIAGRWAERGARGFTHTYKHTQTASVDFMSFVFTCFHRHWWRIFPQFLCDCCSPASHAVHVTEASRVVLCQMLVCGSECITQHTALMRFCDTVIWSAYMCSGKKTQLCYLWAITSHSSRISVCTVRVHTHTHTHRSEGGAEAASWVNSIKTTHVCSTWWEC